MIIKKQKFLLRFYFVWGFLIVYLILSIFGKDILSPKWWIDSARVESFLDNPDGIEGSFRSTAEFLYYFGEDGAFAIKFLSGVLYILILSKGICDIKSTMVVFCICVPSMLLNNLWIGKETVVIIMSIIVYFCFILLARKSVFYFYLTVVIFYAGYAYYFRIYYILIIMYYSMVLYFIYIRYFSLSTALFLIFIFSAFLPQEFYELSQGQRDNSNSYADILGSDNRTSFNNIAPAGWGVNYLLNYLWASLNIFIPLTFYRTVNDVILQLYNILYITLVFFENENINNKDKNLVLLSLFMCHVFVQVLFEPDLGSFFRHSLSSSIYLVPSIKNLFEKNENNNISLLQQS